MSNFNDDWLDQLIQRKLNAKNTTIQNNDGYQDVTAGQMSTHKFMQQQNNPSAATTKCKLIPGTIFYRPLKVIGWPAKYPVCREGGTIPENAPEFEYKGELRVVLVEGNKPIDFSKIEENSPNLISLVEVSSFFNGSILVPRSSIQETFMSGPAITGKKVLMG